MKRQLEKTENIARERKIDFHFDLYNFVARHAKGEFVFMLEKSVQFFWEMNTIHEVMRYHLN